MDAGYLNKVANHPAVRPHIGCAGMGALDYTAALANPNLHAIAVEHGAFLFDPLDHGRYELHTFLLPEGRGAGVLPAAAEAFRLMFVETDCTELVTKVAGSNRPADLMARRAGFSLLFERAGAWEDGSDLRFFGLTIDVWLSRDEALAAEGQAFHRKLEAAKAAAGSRLPAHADDLAHDRAAGAAALMAKRGNPAKALWTYNRWARLAGYQTIQLLSSAPPTFDIGDAVLTFRNDEMEILKCRVQR